MFVIFGLLTASISVTIEALFFKKMITGYEFMQPVVVPGFVYGDGSHEEPSVRGGLTIRQYFAAMRKEPIFGSDTLSISWAEAIMGSEVPSFNEKPAENIQWWITAHERFSVMRADALIAELNKEKQQ